jgi:hypothetical protein
MKENEIESGSPHWFSTVPRVQLQFQWWGKVAHKRGSNQQAGKFALVHRHAKPS